MANIQFFLSIFSKWPMSHRSAVYLKRILWLIFGLVVSVLAFVHLNEIPTKIIDINLDGYGVSYVDSKLSLSLGRNTDLRARFDSTFKSGFGNSAADGISMDIEAVGGTGDYLLFDEVAPIRDTLGQFFQEDAAKLDSLNAMIRLHMVTTDVNQRLRMFGVTSEYQMNPKRIYDQDKNNIYAYLLRSKEITKERDSLGSKVITDQCQQIFFQDSILYVTNDKSVGKQISFLNNRSIWQASDISQSYVGVHLSGALHPKYPPLGGEGEQGFSRDNWDHLKSTLSIDFGSPVTFSSMTPEPDSVSMTGMSFTSPEKILKITSDGIVFHVTFEQNKNLQAVKIFWVTTIIAALLGLFFDQAYKWGKYLKQKRRMEKRKKERRGQFN